MIKHKKNDKKIKIDDLTEILFQKEDHFLYSFLMQNIAILTHSYWLTFFLIHFCTVASNNGVSKGVKHSQE